MRRRAALAAPLVVVGLVCPTLAGAQTAGAPAPVLVVPFDTQAREPRSFWLGEGSAVILTDSLRALGWPAMRRDERVRAFERLSVPAVAGLTRATAIRVGQLVGASRLVVGSVGLTDETLTVRARAILIASGEVRREIVESGPLSSIFDVYDRVARQLVPAGSATREALDASHPPIAAFEQYIKGLLAESPPSKLAFLREALRLSPSLQRAHIAEWEVQNDLGEHNRALAAARQVPAGHRLGRQARFLASISLLQLQRYAEAFALLTGLNREEPDAALSNNLGVVQLRRPPDSPGGPAVMYFTEAARLGAVDAMFNLGYADWLAGDSADAADWLREAIRRDPADHAAHYVLAAALDTAGHAEEASRERELARRLSPTYADFEATSPASRVPAALERIRTALGQPASPEAAPIVVSERRDQPELAAPLLQEARRAYEAQRDLDALAALRRAIYLSPYDDRAELLRARTYLRVGRISEAIDALKISIWSRDTIEARVVLADTLARSGAVDEAREEAQQVLTRDPGNREARRVLDELAGR